MLYEDAVGLEGFNKVPSTAYLPWHMSHVPRVGQEIYIGSNENGTRGYWVGKTEEDPKSMDRKKAHLCVTAKGLKWNFYQLQVSNNLMSLSHAGIKHKVVCHSDSVLLVSAQQSRQIHSPPRHTVTPTGSELGPFPTAHQPPLWPQHQHPPLSVNVWVGVRMWACKTCPHIRNTQVFPKLEESVLLDRNQDDHHLIILLYLNISCNRAVCWYQKKKKKLIRKNTQD